ncbi:MAG: hypothetical protein AAFV72_19205 [Cyanobacteria bacterium J06635_1]
MKVGLRALPLLIASSVRARQTKEQFANPIPRQEYSVIGTSRGICQVVTVSVHHSQVFPTLIAMAAIQVMDGHRLGHCHPKQ